MKTAQSLGLTGWVRNRRNGTIEVVAIGEAAILERLIEACREGSPRSEVDRVDVEDAEVETLEGFELRGTC